MTPRPAGHGRLTRQGPEHDRQRRAADLPALAYKQDNTAPFTTSLLDSRAVVRVTRIARTESVPILLVGLFAIIVAANLGLFVTTDTWLALVSGREIATSGLPETDVLTVWSAGEPWVDQQWLGQVVLYGLHSLGGLRLVALLHALLVVTPFATAVAITRRRGASVRSTAAIGVLAIECMVVGANIRTQSFAFGLFVVVLWLLASDQRAPSNRVFWTVPILVAWSNLHGSVVLGAALVSLAGVLSVYAACRLPRGLRRPLLQRSLLLVILALSSVFVSPYAASLPSYYESTLFNSQLRTLAVEWGPPPPSVVWSPFFILAGVVLVVLGRAGSRLTAFERIALVGTLVMALTAYRNLAWFGLTAVMFVPSAVRTTSRADKTPPPIAAVVSGLVGVAVVAIGVVSLAGLDTTVRERFPPAVVEIVARAAERDPKLQIYADIRYADWLLWYRPQLSGRILFDARFELLSATELRGIASFAGQIGADWRDAAGTAQLLVLEPKERPLDILPTTPAVLLRAREARALYVGPEVSVILRGSNK